MTELSFQLYSARNVPSLEDFLVKLGKLGYTQTEGFGGLYADAAGLAANLKKNGLSMPTGHFGPAQVADVSTTLKTAETLGMKKIIVPHIGPEGRSEDESKWLELAETLAKAGETYAKATSPGSCAARPIRSPGSTAMAAASPPSTSRTSPPPARISMKTAGPMSAMACSIGTT